MVDIEVEFIALKSLNFKILILNFYQPQNW